MLRDKTEKPLFNRYSSFTIVENTLSDVVQMLIKNPRLNRLLYYTDPAALSLPALTTDQTYSVLQNQIRIVPKLETESDAKPYVILTMDSFVPDEGQTTFRSCVLGVDIIVPYEYWKLQNFKLRPYSIAGEIDAMINKSTITSLGIANFAGAKMLLLSPEIGGVSLYYNVDSLKDDLTLNPEELLSV